MSMCEVITIVSAHSIHLVSNVETFIGFYLHTICLDEVDELFNILNFLSVTAENLVINHRITMTCDIVATHAPS